MQDVPISSIPVQVAKSLKQEIFEGEFSAGSRIGPMRTLAKEFQEKDIWGGIIPKFRKDISLSGKIMALPMLAGFNLMVYNKTLLEKAEVESHDSNWTMDDFRMAAVTIARRQPDCYGLGFTNYHFLLAWNGVKIYAPKKN